MNETEKEKIIKFRFPKKEIRELYQKAIDELFEKAKKTDEREFVIANLYFSGVMQISDIYDIKKELDKTLDEFFSLFANSGSFESENLLIKIFILLYCHILEFYLFYVFIYGLLDVCSGESFDLEVFKKTAPDYQKLMVKINNITRTSKPDYDKISDITAVCKPLFSDKMTNWQKIRRIEKKSMSVQSEIGKIIISFYNNDLRNAFSHNCYTVSPKGVMLIDCHKLLPIPELLEQITNCFTFYQCLTTKTEGIMHALAQNTHNKFAGKYGKLDIETIKENNGKSHFLLHGLSTGKTM